MNPSLPPTQVGWIKRVRSHLCDSNGLRAVCNPPKQLSPSLLSLSLSLPAFPFSLRLFLLFLPYPYSSFIHFSFFFFSVFFSTFRVFIKRNFFGPFPSFAFFFLSFCPILFSFCPLHLVLFIFSPFASPSSIQDQNQTRKKIMQAAGVVLVDRDVFLVGTRWTTRRRVMSVSCRFDNAREAEGIKRHSAMDLGEVKRETSKTEEYETPDKKGRKLLISYKRVDSLLRAQPPDVFDGGYYRVANPGRKGNASPRFATVALSRLFSWISWTIYLS